MSSGARIENSTYEAFISYRHSDNSSTDQQWATWIQSRLEAYEIPDNLIGQVNERGDIIPERLYPIFRDEVSLPADSDLQKSIQLALDRSKILIVLCSPDARESQYVNNEISYFKLIGKSDRIISALLSGEPNASVDAEKQLIDHYQECFPKSLQFDIDANGDIDTSTTVEPIASDFRLDDGSAGYTSQARYRNELRKQGISESNTSSYIRAYEEKINLGIVKIVAGIIGIPVETLLERDKTYQLNRVLERETLSYNEIAIGKIKDKKYADAAMYLLKAWPRTLTDQRAINPRTYQLLRGILTQIKEHQTLQISSSISHAEYTNKGMRLTVITHRGTLYSYCTIKHVLVYSTLLFDKGLFKIDSKFGQNKICVCRKVYRQNSKIKNVTTVILGEQKSAIDKRNHLFVKIKDLSTGKTESKLLIKSYNDLTISHYDENTGHLFFRDKNRIEVVSIASATSKLRFTEEYEQFIASENNANAALESANNWYISSNLGEFEKVPYEFTSQNHVAFVSPTPNPSIFAVVSQNNTTHLFNSTQLTKSIGTSKHDSVFLYTGNNRYFGAIEYPNTLNVLDITNAKVIKSINLQMPPDDLLNCKVWLCPSGEYCIKPNNSGELQLIDFKTNRTIDINIKPKNIDSIEFLPSLDRIVVVERSEVDKLYLYSRKNTNQLLKTTIVKNSTFSYNITKTVIKIESPNLLKPHVIRLSDGFTMDSPPEEIGAILGYDISADTKYGVFYTELGVAHRIELSYFSHHEKHVDDRYQNLSMRISTKNTRILIRYTYTHQHIINKESHIRLFDINSSECLALHISSTQVNEVFGFILNDEYYVYTSPDGSFMIHRTQDGTVVNAVPSPLGRRSGSHISIDATQILFYYVQATGNSDYLFQSISPLTGKINFALKKIEVTKDTAVLVGCFTSDNQKKRYYAIASPLKSKQQFLVIWCSTTGNLLHQISVSNNSWKQIELSETSDRVLLTGFKCTPTLINLSDNFTTYELNNSIEERRQETNSTFIQGSDDIIAWTNRAFRSLDEKSGELHIYNSFTGEHKATLAAHKSGVVGVRVDNFTEELVSWSSDGTVCLWSLTTYKLLGILYPYWHQANNPRKQLFLNEFILRCSPIKQVASAINSELIASSDNDSIKLWNRFDGMLLVEFMTNFNCASLNFIESKNLLIAITENGELHQWNIKEYVGTNYFGLLVSRMKELEKYKSSAEFRETVDDHESGSLPPHRALSLDGANDIELRNPHTNKYT